MNKKLLSVILLLSVAILCLFAITACEMNIPGGTNTNTHVHEYSDEWTIDKEATCTNEGYKSHHCKSCDAKADVTIIDKLEHNFEDGVCTICGVEDNDVTEESADLEYELSNDKYYYIVYCTDGEISKSDA